MANKQRGRPRIYPPILEEPKNKHSKEWLRWNMSQNWKTYQYNEDGTQRYPNVRKRYKAKPEVKARENKRSKKHYEENKEEILAKAHENYEKNKDKINARRKELRELKKKQEKEKDKRKVVV